MDVFAVEGGDEGLPELDEDVVGDHVALVLDVLDVLVLLLDVLIVADEFLEGQDAGLEVGRVLAEEGEEFLVPGEEAEFHGSFPQGGNICDGAWIVKWPGLPLRA